MRTSNDYILLYAKGVCMGAADVIPGVSGGTVAFISGIYDELLRSLGNIDREAFRLLAKFDFNACWKHINGTFLAVIFAGIITSFLSLARLMTYLLDHHPIPLWSFFFGLILIAAPLALREIKKWNVGTVVAFLIGICVTYALTILTPAQSPTALWFIFIAGALSISATLVPGISGTFMLILIGKFQYLNIALAELNLTVLLVFVLGSALAIVGFSRFMRWILDNYHSATIAMLAGFMLGALNKVWPWRQVMEFVTNHKGQQIPVYDKSILPWDYMATTGKDPQVFQAILLMAIGVFIVVLIEKIAARLKTKI